MRTMDEIGTEYTRMATALGDVNYRITTMKEEVRKIERKMRQLNVEAAGVRNQEANEALKAQAEATVETGNN